MMIDGAICRFFSKSFKSKSSGQFWQLVFVDRISENMLSSLNPELMAIYRAAVESVKPNSLIRNAVRIDRDGRLSVEARTDLSVSLANRDVYIFGAGKAVLGMCEELLGQVDQFNQHQQQQKNPIRVVAGRINVPIGIGPSSSQSANLLSKYGVSYHQCALNNIPDQNSFESTQKIVDLIQEAKLSAGCPKAGLPPLWLGFISGGGSALLALPKPNLTIEDKRTMIGQLVRKGADIVELNTVRSCMSRVKQGKLASLITSDTRTQLVTFIISDIIDDPIDMIASGPTVPAMSGQTVADEARAILGKYQVPINDSVLAAIQDESSTDWTGRSQQDLVQNILIGNNQIALEAAIVEAERHRFKTVNLGSNWNGEASTVVRQLLDAVQDYLEHQSNSIDHDRAQFRGICWLAGGETTINLGDGPSLSPNALGGRCQEMALLFAHYFHSQLHSLLGPGSILHQLNGSFSVMCTGTDGQDGPTPAAGVHQQLYPLDSRLVQAGQNGQLQQSLSKHDSHNFYLSQAPELLIQTGPSGTNVMDIYCLLYTF